MGDDASTLSKRPYEVGYGTPPVHHRFQPGQSGNPRGSSRRKRQTGSADDLILAEAYRPVAIREGDEVERVPALAAIYRQQLAIALRGNGPAQRAALKMVQAIEAKRAARHDQLLETVIEYKVGAEREIERRRKLGITDTSDIQPHPDDILIDVSTGEVFTTELNPKDADKLRRLRLKS